MKEGQSAFQFYRLRAARILPPFIIFLIAYSTIPMLWGQIDIDTVTLEIGWSFCTINCLMLTTGAFLLFTCIRREETPQVIAELSNLSYGIYLIHIMWLGMWVGIFKDEMGLSSMIAIPAIAVCTFMCCWLTCKANSLFPFGQWVIGTTTTLPQRATAYK